MISYLVFHVHHNFKYRKLTCVCIYIHVEKPNTFSSFIQKYALLCRAYKHCLLAPASEQTDRPFGQNRARTHYDQDIKHFRVTKQ